MGDTSQGYVDNLEIELSDAQNEVDWLAGINGELEEELADAYAEIDRLREVANCAEQFLATWDAAARGGSVSNDEMMGRAHGLRQALAPSKQEGLDDG